MGGGVRGLLGEGKTYGVCLLGGLGCCLGGRGGEGGKGKKRECQVNTVFLVLSLCGWIVGRTCCLCRE